MFGYMDNKLRFTCGNKSIRDELIWELINYLIVNLKVCFVSTALQGGKFFAPCSCNIEACGCTGKPIKSASSSKVNFNLNQSDKSNIAVLPKGNINIPIFF